MAGRRDIEDVDLLVEVFPQAVVDIIHRGGVTIVQGQRTAGYG
jgi:hypothetical protein